MKTEKYSCIQNQYNKKYHTGNISLCAQDPERLKDPVDFVQQLLDAKDKFDAIVGRAFVNDKAFQNALNQAFEHFVNLNQRSPEYISLFMDDKLRKGLKVWGPAGF